jgi:hypothetical protein
VLAVVPITARKILVVNGCKDGAALGPLGKACKKCTADQKQKNDGNSPTLIRDDSVGTAHNCCQIGPLGKACKKHMADQKQKNVKKVPGAPEWPSLI